MYLEVCRLLALEYAIDVTRSLPIDINCIGSVRNEAAQPSRAWSGSLRRQAGM
jgi:hypothetical protein